MLNDSGRFAVRCAVLAAAVAACVGEAGAADDGNCLIPTIAFSSTRDDPTNPVPINAAEIYLMDGDFTNERRITFNSDGDGFPALSPDGKGWIVFDSNRARDPSEAVNTSFLFMMKADGTHQNLLIKAGSPTWAPTSKHIAFHASASGTGLPIKTDPGAATFDSDIFVARVELQHIHEPINITNSPEAIDDDPDWSPDGTTIVFTSHSVNDNHNNSVTAEIYSVSVDCHGPHCVASAPTRLTFNNEEERGPAFSPDGSRIAFACRRGGNDFEICVMDADGSNQAQLTNNANAVPDLTPTWSPDGEQILFHRGLPPGNLELWVMNADGTDQTQLTNTPGINLIARWGVLKGPCAEDD